MTAPQYIEDDGIRATPQQRSFVRHYIDTGGDVVEAYTRCRSTPVGNMDLKKLAKKARAYKAHPVVRALLKSANAAARVKIELRAQTDLDNVINKYSITKERIMAELAKIAFADQTQVASWGPDGVTVLDSSTLSDDIKGAVAAVESSGGGEKSPTHVKVKLYDKQKALIDLGRELGMFVEKKELRAQVAVGAKFIIQGLDD